MSLKGRALSEFEEVQVLTQPDQTTRSAILAAIHRIAERANQSKDIVFVYFSTHGSLGRKPGGKLERFLVATDTRMDLLAQTGIQVDALLRVMEAMHSKRKVVVFATCHSGQGKSKVEDDLAKALAAFKSGPRLPLEEVSEATIILTASAFGDTAQESEELGHDIYTYFFLQALSLHNRVLLLNCASARRLVSHGLYLKGMRHSYRRQR